MSTVGLSSGTDNTNDLMANIGFTWKIGGTSERTKRHLPKEYSGKQMMSIYMMQSQVYDLMNKNNALMKTNAVLLEKVDRLEKIVNTLIKNK